MRKPTPVSSSKVLRCAVYTRKSSEEGLEQDFNSLQAQREACEAYIKSQRHEGWVILPTPYDDGGYSGGSLDRPAIKKVLEDVEARAIDIVVVYKVDRLTRSLTDFARMVEIFDAAGVSFVSITQQFNTTTSMGRLTLNVLLSFAQFEREVTGERIRDKITASKQKGMWMGGWVPIGYDRKDRTLTINEPEAKTVRMIFDLFLKLRSVRKVQAELSRLKLRTKAYPTPHGRATGGLPFARGHIYRILSNPLYIGEIEHKGARHQGLHPPIIGRDLWKKVQDLLTDNRHSHRTRQNAKSANLLAGLVYDEAGTRLVSTHTNKKGKRYRYYVANNQSERSADRNKAHTIRISAPELDQAVVAGLSDFLSNETRLARMLRKLRLKPDQIVAARDAAEKLVATLKAGSPNSREIATDLFAKVIVGRSNMKVQLRYGALLRTLLGDSPAISRNQHTQTIDFDLSTSSLWPTDTTKLIVESTSRAKPDIFVVKALARAHLWFEEISSGTAQSISEIAKREGVTDNYVGNLIHLAWLPPKIVTDSLRGDATACLLVRKTAASRSIDLVW